MEIIKVEEKDREYWDQEIAKFENVHPLNAYGWGLVRHADEWKPIYIIVKDDNSVRCMIMILVKKIPFTGLSIMYAPKGPVWNTLDGAAVTFLMDKVKEEGRKTKSIFIRIDPNIHENLFDEENDIFVQQGFFHLENRWTFWNSPRDVYRIDLKNFLNEEKVFESINRDARRCVRKAKKEGLTIRRASNIDDLVKFYTIFNRFSVEKGFMCRKFDYQKNLWNEFIEKGNGQLFLGIYNEEIVGGIICLIFGKKCIAMHMCSQKKFNKLQAYYAYIWESIRYAKNSDCRWFSFRGVGTTPSQENFKRKFNPHSVALCGYYDYAFLPFLYKIFALCEFQILPRFFKIIMSIRKLQFNIVNYKSRRLAVKSP